MTRKQAPEEQKNPAALERELAVHGLFVVDSYIPRVHLPYPVPYSPLLLTFFTVSSNFERSIY